MIDHVTSNQATTIEVLEAMQDAAKFCSLDADDLTANQAESILGSRDFAIELTGNVLTALVRSTDGPVSLCCSIQQPMFRVGQSPIWVARFRLIEAPRTLLTLVPTIAETPRFDLMLSWRGPAAPEKPREVAYKDLQGKFVERSIFSKALNQTRLVTAYLPPSWKAGETYPAVFFADGATSTFMMAIEELIQSRSIPPVVLISAEAGAEGMAGASEAEKSMQTELRAQEYLPGWSKDDRFDRHLEFFADELVTWAIKEFGVSPDPRQHSVAGYSNGGVFAVFAALRKPDFFMHAISMSPGLFLPEPEDVRGRKPSIYISAGLYEPGMLQGAKGIGARLKSLGIPTEINVYAAGHFQDQWKIALAAALERIFPK
ncbi:MAG: alpha/beta hydrolase-fold protein [Hyphomonadaceae bacterium]